MIHEFRVRWYQQNFHRALVQRTHDRLLAIWHRRAGKDEIVLNAIRELSQKEPGTYWHCFPEYAQARKAIWHGVNGHTGKRRIDEIFPPQMRKRVLDNDMFIEFNNGATLQFLGSDRYDATVGAGPRGIAYSEWAICNPAAWAYHSPMIRETNGWAAFITTPRGNNHAKRMLDRSNKSESWFSEVLSIEDTHALTDDVLAEALEEYQDVHGEDFGLALFEQEYLCSFSGAMVGAYFGSEVNRAEREGRVRPVAIDAGHPVHTVMDLGKAANNPIGCFQVIAGQPRWVDFYKPESDDLEDWIKWLDDKGYKGNDYVPHDIMVTEWGTKRTRFDTLKALGRKPVRIARVSVADGLQAARKTINESVMHGGEGARAERVAHWIDGCKNYRREWDDDLKTFRETPVKDWAEHIGSMTRYLGLSWREVKPPVEKPVQDRKPSFTIRPDGTVISDMAVRDRIEELARRRRANG